MQYFITTSAYVVKLVKMFVGVALHWVQKCDYSHVCKTQNELIVAK